MSVVLTPPTNENSILFVETANQKRGGLCLPDAFSLIKHIQLNRPPTPAQTLILALHKDIYPIALDAATTICGLGEAVSLYIKPRTHGNNTGINSHQTHSLMSSGSRTVPGIGISGSLGQHRPAKVQPQVPAKPEVMVPMAITRGTGS